MALVPAFGGNKFVGRLPCRVVFPIAARAPNVRFPPLDRRVPRGERIEAMEFAQEAAPKVEVPLHLRLWAARE